MILFLLVSPCTEYYGRCALLKTSTRIVHRYAKVKRPNNADIVVGAKVVLRSEKFEMLTKKRRKFL